MEDQWIRMNPFPLCMLLFLDMQAMTGEFHVIAVRLHH